MSRHFAASKAQHLPTCLRFFSFYRSGSLQIVARLSTLPTADALAPGSTFTLTKRFSLPDVAAFLDISGDYNPIHTQEAAARAAGLPGCILPGMLSASLFPAIIGSTFPGAVYLSQTLKFKKYALVKDTLTATVRVEKVSGSRVSFLTQCHRTDSSELLVDGTALAIIAPGGEKTHPAKPARQFNLKKLLALCPSTPGK